MMPKRQKDEFVQIMTAVEKSEDARRISDHLVRKKLAACVQVICPMTSTYRWKGKVEVAIEHLLLIKTRKGLYKQVEIAIKALHPYEVPEIIATPIIAGSKDYLEWIRKETEQ